MELDLLDMLVQCTMFSVTEMNDKSSNDCLDTAMLNPSCRNHLHKSCEIQRDGVFSFLTYSQCSQRRERRLKLCSGLVQIVPMLDPVAALRPQRMMLMVMVVVVLMMIHPDTMRSVCRLHNSATSTKRHCSY